MKTFYILPVILLCFTACAQNNETHDAAARPSTDETHTAYEPIPIFSLNDYLSDNAQLTQKVEEVYNALDSRQRVAQLIMPAMGRLGQPTDTIDQLVKEGLIGGILLLNGTKNEFTNWVKQYNNWNDSLGYVPFLYSADAEPSLVNRKIINSTPVAKANTLTSKNEVISVANTITDDLNDIGINYNFAPVVDMSPNKTVGWRSFGHQPDSVIPWSNAFIQASQDKQVIATAKHFPGHGFVEGDTHKKLVYINGEMKEVKNYPPVIDAGVLSVMIAHIAVKNNDNFSTEDQPASISKKIVTDLLRDSLNFEGLIVTDALNMGGVSFIPDAEVLAIKAGCDIILMPLNARLAHKKLLVEYKENEETKRIIDAAVKRIIRAKICLNLI